MLLRAWRWLVGGCDHHWVIETKIMLYSHPESKRDGDLPCGKKYVLQCDKCGWIRAKRVV